MITSRFHLLLIGTFTIFLASCAHQQPKAPMVSEDWPRHQAQVEAIQQWQALGKLGVKVPNDGGSANLRWQQMAEQYQIDLNGPLGSGKMTIAGQPNNVTLTEAGTPPQTAKSAEELIRKNTGWNIPVTQLAFWVRGLPAPHSKVTHLTPNPQGLIGELEQLGWKVTYGDYLSATQANETIALPGRITAEYQNVRLTLLIREWNLNPAPLAQ